MLTKRSQLALLLFRAADLTVLPLAAWWLSGAGLADLSQPVSAGTALRAGL